MCWWWKIKKQNLISGLIIWRSTRYHHTILLERSLDTLLDRVAGWFWEKLENGVFWFFFFFWGWGEIGKELAIFVSLSYRGKYLPLSLYITALSLTCFKSVISHNWLFITQKIFIWARLIQHFSYWHVGPMSVVTNDTLGLSKKSNPKR